MKNRIKINTKKDEIIIKIDDESDHKEIITCLKKKITDLKKLYQNDKTPIIVQGKVLKNKEIDEIQNLIKKHIDVELKFDSPKVLGLHSIKRTFSRQILTSETKFYRGSLRSGQKLEFEGSIVIVGDVNGGAEVISGENIIIVGALRGLAHAGAKGNKKAIIAASRIDTPQIRIANLVKEMKKEENMCNKMYVYVQDNEVIID